MKLVSFLVPTFNVGNQIKKCLESLINQPYPNYEIIIVDGGSTDDTLPIIQKYMETHKNIFLYNCEQFGISFTRNKLLDKANGEYLVFVDGDDYIEKDMISVMMKFMNDHQCDIVSCGYTMDYPLFKLKRNICKTGTMTSMEAIHSLVSNSGFNNYLWGKIYHKSCFEGIRFPTSFESFEDAAIMFLVLSKAKKIGNIHARYYHYVQRNGSLTSKMDLKTTYDMRNAYRYQEKILKQMFPNEAFDFSTHYYNMDLYIIYTIISRCDRSQKHIFYRSNLDLDQFGMLKKSFYKLALGAAKLKMGKNLDVEIDTY